MKLSHFGSMYLTWPLVALCVIPIARLSGVVGTYVPGKAFDRFVTMWLENEVGNKSSIKRV